MHSEHNKNLYACFRFLRLEDMNIQQHTQYLMTCCWNVIIKHIAANITGVFNCVKTKGCFMLHREEILCSHSPWTTTSRIQSATEGLGRNDFGSSIYAIDVFERKYKKCGQQKFIFIGYVESLFPPNEHSYASTTVQASMARTQNLQLLRDGWGTSHHLTHATY